MKKSFRSEKMTSSTSTGLFDKRSIRVTSEDSFHHVRLSRCPGWETNSKRTTDTEKIDAIAQYGCVGYTKIQREQ